jgi:acylphosphatase
MATLHLIIQGKVQGVFYRVSARKKALEIGISGWIKNTPEHHVEVMAYALMNNYKNLPSGVNKVRRKHGLITSLLKKQPNSILMNLKFFTNTYKFSYYNSMHNLTLVDRSLINVTC